MAQGVRHASRSPGNWAHHMSTDAECAGEDRLAAQAWPAGHVAQGLRQPLRAGSPGARLLEVFFIDVRQRCTAKVLLLSIGCQLGHQSRSCEIASLRLASMKALRSSCLSFVNLLTFTHAILRCEIHGRMVHVLMPGNCAALGALSGGDRLACSWLCLVLFADGFPMC
jgi:hypothetical protein